MKNDSPHIQNEPAIDIPSAKQKRYSSWVGLVMGFLIPGSAHALTGRYIQGGFWFFTRIVLNYLVLAALLLSGKWFYWGVVAALVLLVVYEICLLVSSWRPVRQIGYFGWMLFVVVLAGLVVFVHEPCANLYKQHGVELFSVSGMSMAPTLVAPSQQLPSRPFLQERASPPPQQERPSPKQADRIVVNKLVYRFAEPRRGDIAVHRFISPYDDKPVIYVHRIVGLPGETIDIAPPYVLVNGQKLLDPPIFEKISSSQNSFSGYFSIKDIGSFQGIELPVTLGDDEYFILGDNSAFSSDSRMHGPVKRSDILGRVTHIYYPFSRIGEPE